jgi:hypothetical protein
MLEHEVSMLMKTFLDSKGVNFDDSFAFNMELVAEKNVDETEEAWNVYILDEMSFKVYEYYFWQDDLTQWEETDVITKLKEKSPLKEYNLKWEELTS